MRKEDLIEVIRRAYTSGIDDCINGCEQWCAQGSKERAEDILEEIASDGDIPSLNDA